MKTNRSVFKLAFFAVLAFGLYTTCDVGLGDAVDTKAPKLAIVYPPVQSVIRNTFTLRGTASDEVSAPSVSVVLSNTATGATFGPYSASIDAALNAWSLFVNARAGSVYEIPDGAYEVTATAKDSAGRTSVAKTTYKIDNTAPVLVLNRPSTFGPLDPVPANNTEDEYGTELKVTGSVNDDHAIDRLVFTAYDVNGVPVGSPLSYDNISGVGMELVLAKYYAAPATADEIAQAARYTSLWDPAGPSEQQFYCTIDVSDSAREFTPPAAQASASNDRGNVSSGYYIYDEIYSSVFDAAGFAVTMKDLTSVFNGTYADPVKAAQIVAYLDTKRKDSSAWSTSSATFSLNPDNNPSWTLVGFLPFSGTIDIDTQSIYNDSKVTIRASVGRDDVPLLSDSLAVTLDPCSSAGVPLSGAGDDIALIRTVADLAGDPVAIAARASKISKSGSDYVISTNIGVLSPNSYYLVRVTGVDQAGSAIADANGPFAFYVVPTGDPPSVTTDAPFSSTVVVDRPEGYSITGTITDTLGLMTLSVTQKNGSGDVVTVLDVPDAGGATTYALSLAGLPRDASNATVDPADYAAYNDSYEYEIVATNLANKTTTVLRRARFDTEGPEVTIVKPADGSWSSVDTDSDGDGDVLVTGVATDLTGVLAVYYATGATSPAIPATNAARTVPANWTGWISAGTGTWGMTLANLPEGTTNLHAVAVDTLGNASAIGTRAVNVDLALPTITSTTSVSADTRELFGLGGEADDTNEVASVTMTQTFNSISVDVPVAYDAGTNAWSVANLPRDPAAPANPVDMVGDDGVYDYAITVTDVAGKTREVTHSVRFDRTPPAGLSFVTPTDAAILNTWYSGQSVAMSGGVSDGGSGLASVEYSLNGTDWFPLSFTAIAWNGTITLNEGTQAVQLRAVDKAGNVANVTRSGVKVDLSDPELSVLEPSSLVRVRLNQDIPVTSATTDVVTGGGVQTVRIVRIGSTNITPISLSGPAVLGAPYAPTTGNDYDGGWTGTIPYATLSAIGLADGAQYSVTVEATDRANRKRQATFSFSVDFSPPSVSFQTPAAATVNKVVEVSGTASDVQGLDAVTLEIQRSDSSWETLETFTGVDSYGWTRSFDTVAYGTAAYDSSGAAGIQVTLRATATDTAGNQSSVTKTVTVDQETDRPIVKLSNVNINGTTILKMTGTVYGTVTDDDGVDAFQISEDGLTWHDVTPSGGTWSWDSLVAGDGEKYLYFRVVDDAEPTPTAFQTGQADSPVVQFGVATGGGAVTYRVDTVPPQIDSTIYVDRTSAYDQGDKVALVNNMVFGGATKQFTIALTATDANGINNATGVKVSIPALSATPYAMTGTFTNGPLVNANEIRSGGEYQIVSGTGYSGAGGFGAADDAVGTIFTATRDGKTGDAGVARQKIYVSPTLDVSSLSAEQYIPVSLEVTDTSTLKTTVTRTILVDNVAPTVTHQSPLINATVNGDIEVKGLADDGLGSGVVSVKYQIGKNAVLTAGAAEWAAVTDGLFSWQIDFKGAGSNIDVYGNATYGTETAALSGLWIVPVVMRVEDAAGNVGMTTLSTYTLKVDPNGDRPKVKVTYPSPTATNRTMGGIIRIFGSAEDDDGVATVELEVDSDIDGNANDTYTADGTVSWNVEINGAGQYDPSDTPVSAQTIRTGIRYQIASAGTTDFAALFGAPDNSPGTVFTANANGTAGSGSGTVIALIKQINFRVRAIDIQTPTPVSGDWSDWYSIFVDKNIPKIGSSVPLYLENSSGIRRPYVADMWVKGDWTLRGSVEDESGVKTIAITGNLAGSLGGANSDWFVQGDEVTAGKYNYDLAVDVDTTSLASESGTLSFKIAVTDHSSPTMSNSMDVSIKYDNSAPTFPADDYGGDTPIAQSNKTYAMAGDVSEIGSGLSWVAFFFRRAGTVTRIYDPGVSNPAEAAVRRIDSADYVMEDGLPRLHLTGIIPANRTLHSLTHADLVGNASVRVGGLVKIGGMDRLITEFDSGSGTVSWADSVEVSVNEAWVAYAQVVNNPTEENANWSADNSEITGISNDDLDGMIEHLSKEGTSYEWKAYINSKNIPDGPIELCYVACDAAGNLTSKSVVTRIENRRPLVSRVIVGTDLNGLNGTADAGERENFSALDGNGKSQAVARIASSAYKLKGDSTVVFEILGEVNGNLGYVLTNALDDLATTTVPVRKRDTESGPIVRPLVALAYDAGDHTFSASLPTTLLDDNPDGARKLSFTLWDETDESDPGWDSQYAIITVPVVVDVVDGVSPVVVINRFHWTGAADNSLYGNSPENGHIDLEDDLPTDNFLPATTTGVYDRDPKVSGQVTFTGTAYDDQRLTRLYMRIDDFAFANDPALLTHPSQPTYVLVSERVAGTWTSTGDYGTNGWHFTVLTGESLGQDGHSISWKLDWNSARLGTVTGTDKNVRIIAVDRNPNSSSPTAGGTAGDETTYNNPYYRVDVVPYVRSVTTSMSSMNLSNPSVYDRTALGAYPIGEGESVSFTGFNLRNGGTNPAVAVVPPIGTNLTPPTITGSTETTLAVTVPAGTKSGAFSLTVNSVPCLNNLNGDAAAYNSRKNGVNNDLLDDDVSVDVWTFKKVSDPRDGVIIHPEMKIGPSGEVGFAFVNGNFYFNMAGPSTVGDTFSNTLTTTWASQRAYEKEYAQYYESALAFDATGRTYGMSTNIDVYQNAGTVYSAYTSLYFGQRAGLNPSSGQTGWNNTTGNYRGGLYRRRLQSTTSVYTGGVSDTDPNRALSPSLATSSHGSRTNVYMAFYDAVRKEIRYRYGRVGAIIERQYTARSYFNPNTTVTTSVAHGLVAGDLVTFTRSSDTYMPAEAQLATYTVVGAPTPTTFTIAGNITGTIPATGYVGEVTGQITDATGGWSTTQGVQAGPGPDDGSVRASQYTVVAASGASGKHVAVGVVPGATIADDVVVIAWYDAAAKALKYGYSASPQQDDATFTVSTIETQAGWYPRIAVDKNGGIHVAYYSTSGADLKYAYAQNYSSAFTAVTVDSYQLVGTQATIDVAIDAAGNVVPYIGYYMASSQAAKVAYPVKFTANKPTLAGVTGEKYTGNWEIATVPTQNNTPKDDTISVGVHKNWTTGVLAAIESDTGTFTEAGSDNNTPSRIGGNGTTNPAVSFTIQEDDSLKMAQKN